MPKKDSQRQRSKCACVGAYIFDTHPKCRKHSSGLDCQYFAPVVAVFKCCDICAPWSEEQWIAFRRALRIYMSHIMSSKKVTSSSEKKSDSSEQKSELTLTKHRMDPPMKVVKSKVTASPCVACFRKLTP
jgi:hypothetical protein